MKISTARLNATVGVASCAGKITVCSCSNYMGSKTGSREIFVKTASGQRLPEMSFVVDSIPQERKWGGHLFPLTLQCQAAPTGCDQTASIKRWLQENAGDIDSKLQKHKAILFRCGDQISTHGDFHAFVEALNYKTMPYVGGAAVRTQLTERVFTANESPSSESIPFHHEMAQTPHPPTHLFFFCEVPPQAGGATPILVSAEVCERLRVLQPEFMADLERCGVRYVRVMPEQDDPTSAIGRGWRSTFQCNDRGKHICSAVQYLC
jgi:hypothetical protein